MSAEKEEVDQEIGGEGKSTRGWSTSGTKVIVGWHTSPRAGGGPLTWQERDVLFRAYGDLRFLFSVSS